MDYACTGRVPDEEKWNDSFQLEKDSPKAPSPTSKTAPKKLMHLSSEQAEERRLKNNEMERVRTHAQVDALHRLARALPPEMMAKKRWSKQLILSSAISYIRFLDELISNETTSVQEELGGDGGDFLKKLQLVKDRMGTEWSIRHSPDHAAVLSTCSSVDDFKTIGKSFDASDIGSDTDNAPTFPVGNMQPSNQSKRVRPLQELTHRLHVKTERLPRELTHHHHQPTDNYAANSLENDKSTVLDQRVFLRGNKSTPYHRQACPNNEEEQNNNSMTAVSLQQINSKMYPYNPARFVPPGNNSRSHRFHQHHQNLITSTNHLRRRRGVHQIRHESILHQQRYQEQYQRYRYQILHRLEEDPSNSNSLHQPHNHSPHDYHQCPHQRRQQASCQYDNSTFSNEPPPQRLNDSQNVHSAIETHPILQNEIQLVKSKPSQVNSKCQAVVLDPEIGRVWPQEVLKGDLSSRCLEDSGYMSPPNGDLSSSARASRHPPTNTSTSTTAPDHFMDKTSSNALDQPSPIFNPSSAACHPGLNIVNFHNDFDHGPKEESNSYRTFLTTTTRKRKYKSCVFAETSKFPVISLNPYFSDNSRPSSPNTSKTDCLFDGVLSGHSLNTAPTYSSTPRFHKPSIDSGIHSFEDSIISNIAPITADSDITYPDDNVSPFRNNTSEEDMDGPLGKMQESTNDFVDSQSLEEDSSASFLSNATSPRCKDSCSQDDRLTSSLNNISWEESSDGSKVSISNE